MQDRVGEPMIEILAADFSRRHRILRLAVGAVGRTSDTDVEMIVVPVIGPHLVEPASIIAGLAAQRLLDGGVDEDALDKESLAAALMICVCVGVHTSGSTSLRSAATIMVADISSRSRRVSSRSGIGVSQMSASRPI